MNLSKEKIYEIGLNMINEATGWVFEEPNNDRKLATANEATNYIAGVCETISNLIREINKEGENS